MLSGGERSLVLLVILDRCVDLPDNLPYVRISALFTRPFYRLNVLLGFRSSTQLYPSKQENLQKKRNLTGHYIRVNI